MYVTLEAQRIAIAQACGWKTHQLRIESCWGGNGANFLCSNCDACYASPPWEFEKASREWCGEHQMKVPQDYLSDLNAMHEAEKVLKFSERIDYIKHLQRIMGVSEGFIVVERQTTFATAAQRAEAFLRTLNLWK